MMMLNSNKQVMYYAERTGDAPIYETDDDGNIIYVEVDGEMIPVETGETEPAYALPVKMLANISFGSSESTAQEFGVSISDYDAIVVYGREEYPLTETCLIWFESEPEYRDAPEGSISPKSADYQVKAIHNTLNESRAILVHLVK